MCIITVYCCICLIVSINSSPVDTQLSSDDMDDFYHGLKDIFQQYIKQFPSNIAQNREGTDESTPQTEITESFEFETKLKRDSSAAEAHAQKEKAQQTGISPLYPCDRYDFDKRTCVNIRQIGTTLTLGVKMEDDEIRNRYRIRWYRHFNRRQNLLDLREELGKGKSPWNINIGGNNKELRISPITETDFSYNYFVASAESVAPFSKKHHKQKHRMDIKFYIEPINIDMGVLYPGEELVIYARAFMELPIDSIVLEWSLSNSDFTTWYDLPSNMKINIDGSSVMVKELRTSVDRVLTCSVYSNRNIFVARRNFLFRKIGQGSGRNFDLRQSYKRRRKRSFDENEGFLESEDIHRNSKISLDSKKYDHRFNNEPDREMHSEDENKLKSPKSSHPPHRGSQSLFYAREEDDDDSERRNPEDVSQENEFLEDRNLALQTKTKHSSYRSRRAHSPLSFEKYTDDNSVYKVKDSDSPDEDRFYESKGNEVRFNREDNNYPLDDENNKESQLNGLIQKANSLVYSPNEKVDIDSDFEPEDGKVQTFDDLESILISDCKKNSDCSLYARCQKDDKGNHFCRCSSRYKGNGIFCWLI